LVRTCGKRMAPFLAPSEPARGDAPERIAEEASDYPATGGTRKKRKQRKGRGPSGMEYLPLTLAWRCGLAGFASPPRLICPGERGSELT
jgi:hypothetical protein